MTTSWTTLPLIALDLVIHGRNPLFELLHIHAVNVGCNIIGMEYIDMGLSQEIQDSWHQCVIVS